MRNPAFRRVAASLFVVGCFGPNPWARPGFGQEPTPGGCSGVVLESVEKGGEAERSGLRVGDELLAWSGRGPGSERTEGRLCEWWELEDVEVAVAAHGTVEIRGERAGTAIGAVLPADYWSVDVRPQLEASALTVLSAVREGAGVESLDSASHRLAPAAALWWQLERGRLEILGERVENAAEAFTRAREMASDLGVPLALEIEGRLWRRAGEWERAVDAHRRLLAMREAQDPDSLFVARAHAVLSASLVEASLLDEAARHEQRELELFRRLAPGSYHLRDAWNHVGVNRGRRGDLAAAEAAFTRAYEIHERLAPDRPPPDLVNNLGIVATIRGDYEAARSYFETDLETPQRADPNWRAASLINLGILAARSDELVEARSLHEEALALLRRERPDDERIEELLTDLGMTARRAGDLELAARRLGEAERGLSEERMETLFGSRFLTAKGELARDRGLLDEAGALFARSLALRERFAPESFEVAQAHWNLGLVERLRGDLVGAAQRFGAATRILDRAIGSVGGGVRGSASFRGRMWPLYRDHASTLIELGRAVEAFELTERARARGFAELLEQRGLSLASESSKSAERSELVAAIGRISAQLADAGEGERARLRQELETLRSRHRRWMADAAEGSTRSSRLLDLRAVSAERVASSLPENAVLVSYLLGEDRSWGFVLTRELGLEVVEIPAVERQVDEAAMRFRELLAQPAGPLGRRGRESAGNQLRDWLLQPIARRLSKAERLVVVPDGALHEVPFAALPSPTREGALVVEEVAVLVAPTASLARAPEPLAGPKVLIAADPDLDSSPWLAAASARGLDLSPLPSAREEAQAIVGSFPSAVALVGAEASESAFTQRAPAASVVHLATHARVDDAFPLDSTVYLSASDAADGQLRAWEVLEGAELDADLVVLSGCETARGRGYAGEGILGLTRAFHGVGARSVIASLWRVGDRATAELMKRLYRRLATGDSVDQALREAQLSLLRGPGGFDDPHRWAGFSLSSAGVPDD